MDEQMKRNRNGNGNGKWKTDQTRSNQIKSNQIKSNQIKWKIIISLTNAWHLERSKSGTPGMKLFYYFGCRESSRERKMKPFGILGISMIKFKKE
ncbi:hypothetical protein EYC80_009630 [Monilinia laxa]|uniref:Uncharacterized protein n=1 Tax=Monilinia laxa TaxID=61186 RepID=A0A5N6JYE9_MONLA|nr:hypothetical protein EYC80_009630 [Monilinia laxa]